MKISIILLLTIYFFSCSGQHKTLDIDPPSVGFVFASGYNWVISFDEPVSSLKIESEKADKVLQINPLYPQANFSIDSRYFLNHSIPVINESVKLRLTSEDTSSNSLTEELVFPPINQNPADIKIVKINTVKSAKKSQSIVLEKKHGSPVGFKLNLLNHTSNCGIELESYLTVNKSYEFKSSSNYNNSEIRLTATYGLIFITDNNSVITDYYLYYDSTKNEISKLIIRKRFKDFIRILLDGGVEEEEIIIHDINKKAPSKGRLLGQKGLEPS